MLNRIINPSQVQNDALSQIQRECLDVDGHQVWKMVMLSEFPNSVEVFIDDCKSTWSDGANFEELQKGERGEGDREKNHARAARRAKTQVRKRCKMIGSRQMLTLTYRENMQDELRLQRDFKLFMKRLRAYGDFEYVAGIEKQERGALHMHLAVSAVPKWIKHKSGVKVKSYNLIRSVWRGVVGNDNGNIDLTAPRSNALDRIARYISKYIGKSIEEAVFNAKSYWSSKGIPKPTVTKIWFRASEYETADIVALVAGDIIANRGFTDISQFGDRLNAFHWFSFGKPSTY